MTELARVRTVLELEVYKRAYKISLLVHKITLVFPKFEQYGGLADQMRRASKSICANLAEGWGKQTTLPERKQFLRTSLGSATEMLVWIQYICDLGYSSFAETESITSEYKEISAMLAKMLRNTGG